MKKIYNLTRFIQIIILIIFTTTFMIRKSLVGAETKTAESTAIVESVWEMFWLNMVSQISRHVATVLIADSTRFAL